uniref:Galectin n=1 Tax=Steinernema glaseri TaxID=37863 RepID=A0A1I8ARL5_9BILA
MILQYEGLLLLLLLCLLDVLDARRESEDDIRRRQLAEQAKREAEYRRTDNVQSLWAYSTTADRAHRSVGKRVLPVTVDLVEPLTSGQYIRIEGRVNVLFKYLNITLGMNYGYGNEYSPIHMHITKSRFLTGKIEGSVYTFDNRRAGSWEQEEQVAASFQPGQKFVIRILFENDKDFQHVNSYHWTTASTAYESHYIKQASFAGDAVIDKIVWGGQKENKVPFVRDYPPIKEGRIVVAGMYKQSTEYFTLALLNANAVQQFHFKLNFNSNARHKVLANSLQNYVTWSWEQIYSEGAPSTDKTKPFEYTLLIKPKIIQVYAYDRLILNFEHRTPYPSKDYRGLYLSGVDKIYNIIWS